MNKHVRSFYENGKFTIDVDYKTIPGCSILCVENGVWYKFKIDSVEELEEDKYRLTTTSLISVDGKLVN